eukprot:CAMPEP_0174868618 /NCGR_PEP_ID=MMETSP1114-20130205/66301_1 /TAXON_ID=312471 /ORGANISM="Neobodo designis, Strain CCAP 1951/1" /LENGTH=34 /DNA_ID= /DNA_START= /DNA_END= /DNA_ORIENTATION=
MASHGHDELPLVAIVHALQAADPRLDAEDARSYV